MKAKAMNLWGVDPEDGQPILFTHDHIVAQALGGLDQLSNTQTMCCWHNWRKGSKEGLIVLERQRQMKIENGPVTFTYVGIKKEPRIINRAVVCRRTFNFYLNDPGTWDTNKFLDIIWKNAGLCCVEVRLVNNTYRHPVLQKLTDRALADAVQVAHKPGQHSAGLFKRTVPVVVTNWARSEKPAAGRVMEYVDFVEET